MTRRREGSSELAQAIADAKAEARNAELTDADVDTKLDAYNAKQRTAFAV